MKTIHFLSGLPRSGSTVLASLLNQNPDIYATPTSPLLDLLYQNEVEYRKNPAVIANPQPDQIKNLSLATMQGCWQHIDKPVIIDKHRAWPRSIQTMKDMGMTPKVILTTRGIPDVLSSFIRLIHKSNKNGTPNFVDKVLADNGQALNDANRARLLWESYVADPWDSFTTGFYGHRDSIHLVDYDDLMMAPMGILSGIYQFLGMGEYHHDLGHIHSEKENDLAAWGLDGLHDIRPALSKTSPPPLDVTLPYAQYEFWR